MMPNAADNKSKKIKNAPLRWCLQSSVLQMMYIFVFIENIVIVPDVEVSQWQVVFADQFPGKKSLLLKTAF